MAGFADLKGLTLKAIAVADDQISFVAEGGRQFYQEHHQDCCENVHIAEIVGDLTDLIGEPILLAEEVEHKDETPTGVTPPEYPESYTWTFYKLSTIKGSVTIRWLGESNGYYSESVSFSERAQ